MITRIEQLEDEMESIVNNLKAYIDLFNYLAGKEEAHAFLNLIHGAISRDLVLLEKQRCEYLQCKKLASQGSVMMQE